MVHRLRENKGAALIIWILVIAVVVMALIIIIPIVLDVDGSRARSQDEAHEQTAWDSALMENVASGKFDAVYDYYGKKFVGLNEHPYQVEAYGNMKEHEDCVILVHSEGFGDIQLTWISRKTLRERYR